MKDVYIVRHGETSDNREKIIQGQADSPLTEDGKASVKERAQILKDVAFDAVYCSPLGRAMTSLNIIRKEINITCSIFYIKEIMEINFGELTKKPIADVIETIMKHKQNSARPYPGGESGDVLTSRVMLFMEDYIFASERQTFLVITHYGVLETMLRHYARLSHSEIDRNRDRIAKLSFTGKEIKYKWIT